MAYTGIRLRSFSAHQFFLETWFFLRFVLHSKRLLFKGERICPEIDMIETPTETRCTREILGLC